LLLVEASNPQNIKPPIMKRFLILLTILIPALGLMAQKPSIKNWSDGPLTWNDFKGTSVIPGSKSYLKVDLSTTPTSEIVNGHQQMHLSTSATMDRNGSFADSTARTDQRLRYHQLQFDQLELYRRRLQNDLNSGMNGLEADNRRNYYKNLYREQLADIEKETNNGTDDHKLQDWEYYTRKGLDEIGLPPVPEIEPGDWSYGMFIGVGGLFPTSSIKDDFSGCFTFTAGLTGGYKRLKLKADISYGQPQINNYNIFNLVEGGKNLQGANNRNASYLGIGLTLGYSVFDNERITITPHAGGYWSNYGWNAANYQYVMNDNGEEVQKITSTVDLNLKDFNWIIGVDFDIKIHNYVSTTPFFLTGQREQFTSSLRITPFISHANYNKAVPAVKGCLVGITVSYAGIARALHIK